MAARARILSQLAFTILFFVILVVNRFPYTGAVPGDLFLRASPLLPLAALLESHRLCLDYWPALVVLAATLVLGRFFCGWICPLGATIDGARRLLGRTRATHAPWTESLRPLPLIVLLFLLVPALTGVGIWSFLDPLALYHRVATVVIFPLATWATCGLLGGLSHVPVLGQPAAQVATWFTQKVIPEGQNLFLGTWPIALLLATILLLELAAPRFWCRFVCPAGAWLGLLASRAPFRRRVDATCVRCAGCRWVCPTGAIPAGAPETTRLEACTLCMNCLDACPPAARSTTFGCHAGQRAAGTGLSRRVFLGTIAGSVVAVGTLRVGLTDRLTRDRLLRPPGSVPEPLFLDRCIRCLACVRICRSNGGCLQPGTIRDDLLELWAPEAVMRVGYCEYNCNLCGKVCPTGVIRSLAVEEKQKTSMGMAYFDKNRCIPYERSEDCMVCEEHCPVPDKAIQFEPKEVTLPGGTRRVVKMPRIVRELCIGCGICEQKCPLPGAPGVFVVNENAKRLPPA